MSIPTSEMKASAEKVTRVINQIRKIILKEDIAGIVILHSPGNAQFLSHITPTYSAIDISAGRQVSIRVNKDKHYGGDEEAKNKRLTDTANMLHSMLEAARPVLINLVEIEEVMKSNMDINHEKGGDIDVDKYTMKATAGSHRIVDRRTNRLSELTDLNLEKRSINKLDMSAIMETSYDVRQFIRLLESLVDTMKHLHTPPSQQ